MIIDWNMPGPAALDLIKGIRGPRPPQAVRLIILSSLTGEQDVVNGLNLGADDYIAKPFSLRETVARVCAAAARAPARAPASGAVSATSWCSMRSPTA